MRLWYIFLNATHSRRVQNTFPFLCLTWKSSCIQVTQMFYHGFDNYMEHAFPLDELKPLSCTGEDSLGGYTLTLVSMCFNVFILCFDFVLFSRIDELLLKVFLVYHSAAFQIGSTRLWGNCVTWEYLCIAGTQFKLIRIWFLMAGWFLRHACPAGWSRPLQWGSELDWQEPPIWQGTLHERQFSFEKNSSLPIKIVMEDY